MTFTLKQLIQLHIIRKWSTILLWILIASAEWIICTSSSSGVILWWPVALHMWADPSQSSVHTVSLLRCSVVLIHAALVQRLARSQSAYTESGPAVYYFLWITVHSTSLIPMQNGLTGAGRKQFTALTSLLKIWTNCKLRLSHVDVKEKWSRPHTSQLQDVCPPVCVGTCLKLTIWSPLSTAVRAHHVQRQIYPRLPCLSLAFQLVRSHSGASCCSAGPQPRQPGQHRQKDQPQAPHVLLAIIQSIQTQSALWPWHHFSPYQHRWGGKIILIKRMVQLFCSSCVDEKIHSAYQASETK